MPLYEILRDDNVVQFYESSTIDLLEAGMLLHLRLENHDHAYMVYEMTDDLERINESKKTYLPYKDDKKTKGKVDSMLVDIFKDFAKRIKEGKNVSSGYSRINTDGNIDIKYDDCDDCEDYDDCDNPLKTPKKDD